MRRRFTLAVLFALMLASGGCFECTATAPAGGGGGDPGDSDPGDTEPPPPYVPPPEIGAPERGSTTPSGTRSFAVCAHLTGRQWEVCDDREYSRPWPDCIAEQNPLLSQRCWAVYRATKNPYWCEDLEAEGKGCEWLTWISIRRSAGTLSVNPLQ